MSRSRLDADGARWLELFVAVVGAVAACMALLPVNFLWERIALGTVLVVGCLLFVTLRILPPSFRRRSILWITLLASTAIASIYGVNRYPDYTYERQRSLATERLEKGMRSQARTSLQDLLELRPTDLRTLYAYLFLLPLEERTALLKRAYELMEESSALEDIALNYGAHLMQIGRLDEAVSVLRRGIEVGNKKNERGAMMHRLHHALGMAYYEMEDLSLALLSLERAYDLRSRHRSVLGVFLDYPRCLAGVGKVEKALSIGEEGIRLLPQLGSDCDSAEEFHVGKKLYRHQYALLREQAREGQDIGEGAVHLLGDAVVFDPADPGFRWFLGVEKRALGDGLAGRDDLRKAVELGPSQSDVEAWMADPCWDSVPRDIRELLESRVVFSSR